jgi:hypothetical protein
MYKKNKAGIPIITISKFTSTMYNNKVNLYEDKKITKIDKDYIDHYTFLEYRFKVRYINYRSFGIKLIIQ